MSRAGDLLRKIGRGGPKYICPWDGKDVSASMRAPYRASIKDPNKHCGTAIQLDCGHWLLDDCDPKSGLNGMVLGIKDKREVPGETTGIKQLIQEVKNMGKARELLEKIGLSKIMSKYKIKDWFREGDKLYFAGVDQKKAEEIAKAVGGVYEGRGHKFNGQKYYKVTLPETGE